jgi:hypothetical protein
MLEININSSLFDVSEIHGIIARKLREANIVSTGSVNKQANTMTFVPLKSGRLFESAFTNHLTMSSEDKRRKTLGRPFLNTHKLTKEQYETLINAIITTFDKLDVAATIKYKEVLWRDGKTNLLSNIPTPKIFPEKG